MNPANPGHALALDAARTAARSMGVTLQAVSARGPGDFDRAFAAMTAERAGACFVSWDGMFLLHLGRITQLAASSRQALGLTISPSLLLRADQVIE